MRINLLALLFAPLLAFGQIAVTQPGDSFGIGGGLQLGRATFDEDAFIYFASTGVSDSVEKKKVSDLARGIKSLGLWNNIVFWLGRTGQQAASGPTLYSLGGLGSYPGTYESTPVVGGDGVIFTKADSDAINTTLQLDPLGDAGQFTIGLAFERGLNFAVNDKLFGAEQSGATTGCGFIGVNSALVDVIGFRTSFANAYAQAEVPVEVNRGFFVGVVNNDTAQLFFNGGVLPVASVTGSGPYASSISAANSVLRMARRHSVTTYADVIIPVGFAANIALTPDQIRSLYHLLLSTVLSGLPYVDTRGLTGGSLPESLRIAQLNAGVYAWANPVEIAEALSSYNLDVLCLTEVPGPTTNGGNRVAVIAAMLGMNYQVLGVLGVNNESTKRIAILSRWPVSESLETDVTGTGEFAYAVTAALATTISKGGREWRVYTAHVDGVDGEGSAIRNLRTLVNADPSENVVLSADFNHDAKSSEMLLFEPDGWEPIWYQLGIDTDPLKTYRSYDSLDNGVIDGIIFNNPQIEVLDGGIIELDPVISDHKPVWAELQISQ